MFQSFEEWRDDIAEYLQRGIDLWLEAFAGEAAQEIILRYQPDGGHIDAEVRTSKGWERLEYGNYEWVDAHIFGGDGITCLLADEVDEDSGYIVPEDVRDEIKECGLGITTMWIEFRDDSGGGRQVEMAEALAAVLAEAYGCEVTAVRENTEN